MKKISFVFLTMCTFLLSGILMACSFKNPEAKFNTDEIVVSKGDVVNLDDYLEIKGVEKDEVSYLFSNSSIFSETEQGLKAISSGKSMVYVTYQNNSLASMQIVVKKTFLAPTNFSISETGLVSWGVVSGYFENESTPTTASGYTISGTYTPFDAEGNDSDPIEINDTVESNSYQLDQSKKGRYNIRVSANATGYFDASIESEPKTFYFGGMAVPELSTLSFSSDGIFSWGAIAGAKYKIKLDNRILVGDYLETTSQNISSFLDSANSGMHRLSVVVYDKTGEKIASESEKLNVEKLTAPTMEYDFSATDGGKIEIISSNAETCTIMYKKVGTEDAKTFDVTLEDGRYESTLDEIASGAYEIALIANSTEENTYRSSLSNIYNIYKLPQASISGLGENEVNGSAFSAQISASESLVSTNVAFETGNFANIEGMSAGDLSKNFDLHITQAGTYEISAKLIPVTDENLLEAFAGEQVFVLNSKASESLVVTKLAKPTNIVHSYVENNSVLTFDAVDNATNYILLNGNVLVDESKYSCVKGSEKINFVFNGKIDDLFDVFDFDIVAKTENDALTINSSSKKEIIRLSAPLTAQSGNSDDTTYTWQASQNADAYRLEIYELENKQIEDLTGITAKIETVDTNQYVFEKEGYYHIKIYALSSNKNLYLDSKDALEETIHISKVLTLGDVKLGYDEDYVGQNGSLASGYFVRVQKTENVDFYNITIGGNVQKFDIDKNAEKEYSDYLLTENFSTNPISISLTAGANDDEIYLESQEKTLSVQMLEKVTLENIADQNFVYVDELTENVCVKIPTGATKVVVRKDDQNEAIWENSPEVEEIKLSIKNWTNFDLDFELFGTVRVNNIFNGEVIYLDAEKTTIHFERESTPTNFEFYNNKLNFEWEGASTNDIYVLDLNCISGGKNHIVSLRFESLASYATCKELGIANFMIGQSSSYRTIDANKVTIDIGAVLQIVNRHDKLSSVYANATSVEFSTYVFKNVADIDNQTYQLSSLHATCKQNADENALSIEKMQSPTLEFDSATETDYVLKWSPVSLENDEINAETKYEIRSTESDTAIDGILEADAQGILRYSFSKTGYDVGKYYSFYIVATNPYYLGSNNSNIVKIYQLNTLQAIKLSTNGKLELVFDSKDTQNFSKVVINEQDYTTYNNITASIGQLKIKVIGKTQTSGNVTTTFIDSDQTTWIVEDFADPSTSGLKVDCDNNGNLSWGAYASEKGFDSLKYRVIFKDKDENSIYFDTTQTTLNVLSGDVYKAISTSLSAGDVSVQVVAYLDTYQVSQGATLYYHQAQEVLDGSMMFNSYVYAGTTVTKLSTPNVESVEFETEDFSNETYPTFGEKTLTFDLQNPNATVTFAGNYGNAPTVMAFVNDNDVPVFEGVVSVEGGKYKFNISNAYYAFDENNNMQISIKVMVEGTIGSSLGSVTIARADDLSKIEFLKDEKTDCVTTDLKIALSNADSVVGGIVLKVDFKQNGNDETKTQYALAEITSASNKQITLSVEDFIESNLSMGGTISVSAFANSNADNSNKKYYLPSSQVVSTQTIEVLKMVEQNEVVLTEGGFVINTPNGNACTYVVENQGKTYNVDFENEQYYFEIPNDWADGSYELAIFAQENEKISAPKAVIVFEVERIGQVDKESISMTRSESDLSEISISWDAVDGASEYLIRVYDKADLSLMIETTLTSNSQTETYLLADIFGQNYAKILQLADKGQTFLAQDQNLTLDIITIGTTDKNNSRKTSIDLILNGNSLIGKDFNEIVNVDEFGRLALNLEADTEYLYSLTSDSQVQSWKSLLQSQNLIEVDGKDYTLIDTTEFSKIADGEYLNISLAKKGVLEKSGKIFELDTYALTSSNINLEFGNSIVSLGHNDLFGRGLSIEVLTEGFTKIYVGTSETALFDKNVATVTFEKSLIPATDTTNNSVYVCSFDNFLDELLAGGISLDEQQNIKLYFWTYLEPNENVKFLASKPTEFVFDFVVENTFEDIVKVGKTENAHDFANVYATFDNQDSEANTLGIFVRIANSNGEIVTKYISADYLLNDNFANKYAINITKIFEEEDLLNATGDFDISFARLQLDASKKFIITNWTTQTSAGEDLKFSRLNSATGVRLNQGNLFWNGLAGGNYYVYFVQVDDLSKDAITDPVTLTSNYTFNPVKQNYFEDSGVERYDLTNVINENNSYYIAVQIYGGDETNASKFVLPSKRVYVTQSGEASTDYVAVYKNQVSSPLVLQDGKMFINWTLDSEIVKSLLLANVGAESLISSTPFVKPFTFTIADLLNDKIIFRLQFESIDTKEIKTFDINAKDLLANLFEFDGFGGKNVEQILNNLYSNTSDGTVKRSIQAFIEYCKNASYGIANPRKIFDDVFESLQKGAYSLRYCLLGNNISVNSIWYSFKNEQGENLLHVIGEPENRIVKLSSDVDPSYNEYKLIIKKTEIYDYDSASYKTKYAENYVIKLLDTAGKYLVFDIVGNNLSLKNSQVEGSVSVYDCDADGNASEGGAYLMVYINQNAGNSILGLYGNEIEKSTYNMQIYAVGNDYSFSSKSKYHALTFLGIDESISISGGAFVWATQTQSTRKTTVIYKYSNSLLAGKIDIGVSSDGYYSRYSLTDENGIDLSEGWYEYVKFIRIGETRPNSTFIDSEIYQFNNIYKLSAPEVLDNDLGYLSIDVGSTNKTYLEASYSDENIYSYKIYHDKISYSELNRNSYITVADERPNEQRAILPYYYQTGTTVVDQAFQNYSFKDAEKDATSYFVSAIGSTISTSSLTYSLGEDETYNVRTYILKDNEGNVIDKAIALKSKFAGVSAQMMQQISELSIENGILNWAETNMSTSQDKFVDLPIYKVNVGLYEKSATGQNASGEITTTPTNSIVQIAYYTAKTQFDFAMIEDDLKEYTNQNTLIKVSVQVLSLQLCEEYVENSNCVKLVEGGFASGNVRYKDEGGNLVETYVLMSNAVSIEGINRFNAIDSGSLQVYDGKLVWTFTAMPELEESAFKQNYGFEVVQTIGDKKNVVEGDFKILNEVSGTYTIEFNEEKGSFLPGVGNVTVYVTQGTATNSSFVKSFATTLENVEKLATIEAQDYSITSQTASETLDFSGYFAENANCNIITSVTLDGAKQDDIIFTSEKTKLLILNQIPEEAVQLESDYVGYMVITDSQVVKLVFKVVPTRAEGIVYSDLSDEFVLQRSSWGQNKQIVWDEIAQEFSWDYSLNTFNSDEIAQHVQEVYLTTKNAKYYKDADMNDQVGTLAIESVLLNVEISETVAKVQIGGEEFYVLASDIQKAYLEKAEILLETNLYTNEFLNLTAKDEQEQDLIIEEGTQILIISESTNSAKIFYNDNSYYIALDSFKRSTTQISSGELFEIIEENSDSAIIIIDQDIYQVDARKIVKPVYIVEVIYGKTDSITRIYETTEKVFKPTIIGDVAISVRIKLGNINVQSQELVYQVEDEKFAQFNLFASGEGTLISPYLIDNANQFKNIAYRMVKDDYLTTYSQTGLEEKVSDEEQYCFELSNNITDLEFDSGILFKGIFEGKLDGKNFVVEYRSTATSALATSMSVAKGMIGTDDASTTVSFSRGASLFEIVSEKSKITNLNISANFGREIATNVYDANVLVGGLAIKNTGNIDNVNLVQFSNNLYPSASNFDKIVAAAYGGIVAINTGMSAQISNCSILTNMEFSDQQSDGQAIFVGGIAYTNTGSATISNCKVGQTEVANKISVSYVSSRGYVQVGGIVVTCSGANLSENASKMFISVQGSATATEQGNNYLKVYAAQIACYKGGTGTIQNNTYINANIYVNYCGESVVGEAFCEE